MKIYLRAIALVLLTRIAGLPQTPLTLGQAVQQAADKYPAVRASLERVSAADAQVSLARTAYLPRADFLAQLNRATRNNVFGLVLPQSVIPSISGPVLGTNGLTNVWGSAVGVLVSWEPFDFGLRRAHIERGRPPRAAAPKPTWTSRASKWKPPPPTPSSRSWRPSRSVAPAQPARTRPRVRREVGALAKPNLRPGADAARASAESRWPKPKLPKPSRRRRWPAPRSRSCWACRRHVQAQAGPLLALPPEAAAPGGATADHPARARAERRGGRGKAAELHALDRSYFPRFNLQGSSLRARHRRATDGTREAR